MTGSFHRWLPLCGDRFLRGPGHAATTRIGIWRYRQRISTLSFNFLIYLIFLCFLIIWNQKTYFCVTIHSDIYHLHADVGPLWLEGFPRHRWRGRGDNIMGVDAKQTLQSIHTNFMRLTHRVPMVQVKDLPEAMQHQVVGVPWAWVQLFQ